MAILIGIAYLAIETEYGIELFLERLYTLVSGDRDCASGTGTSHRSEGLVAVNSCNGFPFLYCIAGIAVIYAQTQIGKLFVKFLAKRFYLREAFLSSCCLPH